MLNHEVHEGHEVRKKKMDILIFNFVNFVVKEVRL